MYELMMRINFMSTVKDYIQLLRSLTPGQIVFRQYGFLIEMAQKFHCHLVDIIRKYDYAWSIKTHPMLMEHFMYI